MKDLWKSGVLILLIIGVLYIFYLRECKHPLPCPPEGHVLLSQQVWDSIKAVADKPPEVHIDTIYLKGDIVYIPSNPLPIPEHNPLDTTINNYSDSLVNKEINVWVDYEVKGLLLERTWKYVPITTQISIDSIIYKPYPVEIEKLVKTDQNGFYLSGLAGGNKSSFLFGGGLDLITKKETMIGYQYQRFGDENFHSVKLGIKIGK